MDLLIGGWFELHVSDRLLINAMGFAITYALLYGLYKVVRHMQLEG